MTETTPVVTQPNTADRGKELAEIFQDDNLKYSTMRAMSFIALIAAIVFGGLGMTNKDADAKYFTTVFLVAAFAPKAVQRFAERM